MYLKHSSHLGLKAKHLIITLHLVVITTLLQSNAHSHELFFQNLVGVEKGMIVKGVHQLKQYLQKYGYLNHEENHASNDEFDDAVESAVKRYQEFFSLKPTGKLDSDTINQMAKPRCGFPDIIHNNSRMQVNPQYAFFPGNPTWPPSKMNLLYTFISSVVPPPFDGSVLSPLMALAFGKWEAVTKFTFGEVSNDNPTIDITIGFHRRDHGDGAPFDGPGGVLAHSLPPTRGIFHIDADEKWTTAEPGDNEYDLESVAIHEIGHLLGLGHSTVKDAVMFAYTETGVTKRELTQDDIQGIHALYGITPVVSNNKIE